MWLVKGFFHLDLSYRKNFQSLLKFQAPLLLNPCLRIFKNNLHYNSKQCKKRCLYSFFRGSPFIFFVVSGRHNSWYLCRFQCQMRPLNVPSSSFCWIKRQRVHECLRDLALTVIRSYCFKILACFKLDIIYQSQILFSPVLGVGGGKMQ